MAEPSFDSPLSADELNALADRLTDHADGIVNVAAHEMEHDIRLAVGASRQMEQPPPLALLVAAIRKSSGRPPNRLITRS
jgi:hypothetical protein